MTRELRHRLLAPTFILTEFMKIAAVRIGGATARLRLRLLKERGLHTLLLSGEMASSPGSLLLKHQEIPIADALIASPVRLGEADYRRHGRSTLQDPWY